MPPVRSILFVMGGLLLGVAPTLIAQEIAVDSGSAVTRLGLTPLPEGAKVPPSPRISMDNAAPHRSRGGSAAIGFLAGAAAGLVIAHFVNENQRTGEGKLENYLGIPFGLGVFTAATVFVAMGD